jgi:hypothetical protein
VVLEKNLGLLVSDRPVSLPVEFRLPLGTPAPASTTVGKSCCTSFEENVPWREAPGATLTIEYGPVAGRFTWTAHGWTSDKRPLFAFYVYAQVTPRALRAAPRSADFGQERIDGARRRSHGVRASSDGKSVRAAHRHDGTGRDIRVGGFAHDDGVD